MKSAAMKTEIAKQEIPSCFYCGDLIRKSIPSSRTHISQKPWNYLWNGKCESCGRSYNIYYESPISDSQTKTTTLIASSLRVPSPFFSRDTFFVLSGVDAESRIMNGEQCISEYRVFFSGFELKKVVDAISNQALKYGNYSFSHSIDQNQERLISLHRDSLWIDAPSSDYDTDDFLFGFTIEASLKKRGEIIEHKSIFLTNIESEYIVNVLKDSALLNQCDFYMDDT